MLSIAENSSGKVVLHDLHNLKLPGGQLAHELDGGKLYRRLVPLGVVDIDVSMGVQDLLLAYSKHLKAKAEAAA
jgi:hypothetical protein